MTVTERMPDATFEAISAKSLSLRARTLVRGLQIGRHRGSGRGVSSEFASHRPYTPGDEPRRLDWKLFARTRKHYFKETREDSSVRCLILLDSSGSMGIGSKWTTAGTLAAAIARVALGQADATGLTLFAEKAIEELPCTDRPSQWKRIVDAISNVRPQELFDIDSATRRIASRFRQRGLIYLLTDAWDEPARLDRSIGLLSARGHDVRLLRVIDPLEEQLPNAERIQFRDPESHRILTGSSAELAAPYRRAVAEHQRLVRTACLRHGATVVTIRSGQRNLTSALRLSLAGLSDRSV